MTPELAELPKASTLNTKGGFHLLVQELQAPMLQRFTSDGNLKEIITCWRFLL